VQATDEQTTRFKVLAQYTVVARQQAQALQQAAPEATAIKATALQNSLDDVRRAGRDFLKTFSDAQVSGLKKQTKKLNQSDAAVTKEMKKLSAQMDRTAPRPPALHEAAVHLDQALATLQSDQNGLAKEMGTETH
jgi:ABC-type transporter Mla subunit MlaD